MRKLIGILAVAALAGCERTETYESSGTVVDTVNTDTTARLNLPDIDVGMTKDTVTVPVFTTQKDTIIVDKPVVAGKKQVEVKRPTVDVNRKP
jgi:hypothetical protein